MSNDAGGFGRSAHRRRPIRRPATPIGPAGISTAGLSGLSAAGFTRHPVTSRDTVSPVRRPATPARLPTARLWPPPGYPPPGYPPPGYAPPGYAPAAGYAAWPLKPGVIPLRPLSLSDIFNGAVAYVRANPKASLGLTTVVVVAAQILCAHLVRRVRWPSPVDAHTFGAERRRDLDRLRSSDRRCPSLASAVATALVGILLSGHAHRGRRPGRVRRTHHHRRSVATASRTAAGR